MGIPFYHPKPVPVGIYADQELPIYQANPWKRFTLGWITPFFKISHGRQLDDTDPWLIQSDAECQAMADSIMKAHQARIPPSRRTEGYRIRMPAQDGAKGPSQPPDSALLFTPRGSEDSHTRPDIEMLVDPLHDTQTLPMPTDTNFTAMARANSRRSSSTPMGPSFPHILRAVSAHQEAQATTDAHVTEKLAAAGSEDHSRRELIKRYGKRKTDKIIAGRLAVEGGKVYDMSLIRACYESNKKGIMIGLIMLLLGFSNQMCLPLVTRAIIDDVAAAHALYNGDVSASPRSIGATIGLAIGFLAMMLVSNMLVSHALLIAMIVGAKTRSALVDIIARKSMRLSTKSRQKFNDGKLNAFITADTGFAENAFWELFWLFMCPPVICLGIALVVYTIGVAGLAGIGVLAMTAPAQNLLFALMITYRKKHLNALDERTQLLTEVVKHLHSIKLFAYEPMFEERIAKRRKEEAGWVMRMSTCNAIADAIGVCMPAVAAVVTLIIYTAALGNTLDLGRTFATLQYFAFLQRPLTWLPRIFATLANILNASRRLTECIVAEERSLDHDIDPSSSLAIQVQADFMHESSLEENASEQKARKRDRAKAKVNALLGRSGGADDEKADKDSEDAEAGSDQGDVRREPFKLENVLLNVPRGSLVCIVGRVGAGKSTLLTGMIGETKKSAGATVRFGAKLAYVPQAAWVQSGSIRQNICFSGAHETTDENRLAEVIWACGLQEDIARLSDGVDTKVGERGITLSGGQKQRVTLARAAYTDAEIVLLDDPLSAVDAQVGHHLLQHCILDGPLSKRTRILVTHHLDVLPQADILIMMESDGKIGKIVQQGNYQDLMSTPGPFRQLVEEYGSKAVMGQSADTTDDDVKIPMEKTAGKATKMTAQKEGQALMLEEEKEIGSVAPSTWVFWIRNMGPLVVPLLVGLMYVVSNGARLTNTLWVGFWQQSRFDSLTTSGYQGIYAGIAVASALIGAVCNTSLIIIIVRSSIKTCEMAVKRVMRAPTSFLDRTPNGRIVSRLCKDVEAMDTQLSWSMNRVLNAGLAFVGTIGLVAWSLPWMTIAYVPIVALIYAFAAYAQPGNRDVKRSDSVQRSKIYANFGEQLNGMSVIRAFNKVPHFEKQIQVSIDGQNKFTLLRRYMLAWLTIRVCTVIFLMPFAIALYGAIRRSSVDPVTFAITLTYVLQSAYNLLDIVQMLAMLEQDMISVERVKAYTELEQEAAAVQVSDPPASQWPSQGAISFKNVQLRYRPELPLVLKGLTFDVKPGEKVGIIGRTGAGKSSLVQATYRTVELAEGSIAVDGVDLRGLGLHTMRSRLSIIPQESFLFAGTVRQNIDPEGHKTDAELNDALSLIHSSPSASQSIRDKFRLEVEVESEGSNFSAGEKQLLSLMRALVRGCKVLVLDEATSSVDPETDALIQRIIQTEFSNVTLLSIAHRLQTVAFYDRILVMDAGMVAEYDSPLDLFDKPGSIFRSLCDVKKLSRDDIVKIQQDAAK